MSRFRLGYPALVTVRRAGESAARVDPFAGGSLVADLLCGEEAVLEHLEALSPAPPRVFPVAEVRVDVDARALRIVRSGCELDELPALRRAYLRALARAWPGWSVADDWPPRLATSQVSVTLLRSLPEAGAASTLITRRDAAGARDVLVRVPVEEALSLGPSLRAALAERESTTPARELSFEEGVIRAPYQGGALIDDVRGRVEVWWSAPTARRVAALAVLARLWPDHDVLAHDEGLGRQLAGSGRAPTSVAVTDDDAAALLRHHLYVERFVDPIDLHARALATVARLRAAGVAIEPPADWRASRPRGALEVPTPPVRRLLRGAPPNLLRLARALVDVDDALARGDTPTSGLATPLFGPPAWLAVVLDELERRLDPAAAGRVSEYLAGRWRLGPIPDAPPSRVDRLRAAIHRTLRERGQAREHLL
ncbi:MAG: hypothetical protein R3A51_10575 [Nannocystaceae bacterium]